MGEFFTVQFTVEQIVDQKHLDRIIDAINAEAYVSNVSVMR